ncbi:MAG TPA: hypothetical protein VKX25_13670 [Bryobacteraceae bacterium]|nr:hypothetical protein [Bryobacteraceae bacterium]
MHALDEWREPQAPQRPVVDGVFPARIEEHSDPLGLGRYSNPLLVAGAGRGDVVGAHDDAARRAKPRLLLSRK